MSPEEHKVVLRQMTESLQQAIAGAERALRDAEAADCVRLAELAVRGVHVIRWSVPGPGVPICGDCRRTDQWYQWVATGIVRCGCAIPG